MASIETVLTPKTSIEEPKTLPEQVASHQLQRLIRLGSLTLGTVGILGLIISTTHISLVRSHSQVEATNAALTATHKRLSQTWRIRATQAKRLKKLKSQTISTPKAELLTQIAQIIPPRTLLTSVGLKGNTLTLTGYAHNTEELSAFMIGLSSMELTKISLPRSVSGPAGISFVINSCC